MKSLATCGNVLGRQAVLNAPFALVSAILLTGSFLTAQEVQAPEPKSQAAKALRNAPAKTDEVMEFSDQPHFSVAGVTDWTAVGGHGSDITLRASESLTNATAALKPAAIPSIPGATTDGFSGAKESDLKAVALRAPRDFEANEHLGEFYVNQRKFAEAIPPLETAASIQAGRAELLYALARAYEGVGNLDRARETIGRALALDKNADSYRLAGALDEKRDDPLSAVQEFEQAATIDPSEQNEFEWASELLKHRAIWQAEGVFRKGAAAHPKSLRMQAGLGAALFAGARYDEAALEFCKASDLDPADINPYLFLGKIAVAAPKPLDCAESKLARFVQLHPESPTANYLYAVAILKAKPGADSSSIEQAEKSLNKAVFLDPKCSDAYLELGILAAAKHDTEGAIHSYMRAIETDPQSADAHYRLAVAYDRIGEPVKAQQEFALHKQIEQQRAEATEKQRKAVKQFLFAKPVDPAAASVK